MATIWCGCGDCPEIATTGEGEPALCPSCEEAGCTIHENLPGFIAEYGLGHECQRIDMYV
ncbi:hypothetical protein ACIRJ3_05430 [Streptomyces anulatus]